jgi:predicted phage tail protein
VAKVLFYKALHKKRSDEKYTVQIFFENYPLSLLDLPKMPLLQLLYLLREALIGFERLFDRLGGFVASARMIKINKTGRCKVWCHEDVSKNDPLTANAMTSGQFKNQILSIFEEKFLRSVLSQDLFEGLRTSNTMIEGIYFLEKFTQEKTIKIPHKLLLLRNNPQHLNKEQKIPVTNQGLNKCCSVQAYQSRYQISESDGSSIAVRSGVKRKTSDISFLSRPLAENKSASEKSQGISHGSHISKTIIKKKTSIETNLTWKKTEDGR